MSSAVRDRETVPSDPIAVLHGSLASMCRAGVPLPQALATVEADLRAGPVQDAVRGLASDLETGVPLADAYRRHGSVFSPAHAALISAGLAAGDLPGALAEIARHAERRARWSWPRRRRRRRRACSSCPRSSGCARSPGARRSRRPRRHGGRGASSRGRCSRTPCSRSSSRSTAARGIGQCSRSRPGGPGPGRPCRGSLRSRSRPHRRR